jgi:hypothetical protein
MLFLALDTQLLVPVHRSRLYACITLASVRLATGQLPWMGEKCFS